MYLDSPFELCLICNKYVLMDQTYKECRREHRCENVQCPLMQYFLGVDSETEAGNQAKTSDVAVSSPNSRKDRVHLKVR